jgi:Ca2+-binding EF-hand superfamily protein
VDGKALEAAWEEFFDHLFRHLDVKAQGYLGKEEAERAPPLSNIFSGSFGSFVSIYGDASKAPAAATLKDLDTDGDGKVSKREFAAYYRKQGFAPFQFQTETDKSTESGNEMMMMGMGKGFAEPSVDDVAEAIFSLLDTKRSGKLTRAELAAAPELLLRLDTNEDEMITAAELMPDLPDKAPNAFSMGMSAVKNTLGTSRRVSPASIVPLTKPGEAPTDLANRMLKQYAKGKNEVARENLGLDDKTFAALDLNRDSLLNAQELAGFVKRAPDVEYVVHLSSGNSARLGVELVRSKDAPGLLADKIKAFDGLALLDLGRTRVELRGNADSPEDRFLQLMNAQWTFSFKQADTNGDGYLDEKEASTSVFRVAFKAMDRDGDGKVTEQELNAYLELLADLKARAWKACVSLVLTDESRGLFDLLDSNRDGRLSVREMRGAVDLLAKLAPQGQNYLARSDLPHTYGLTVRRGPASDSTNGYAAVLESIYGGAAKAPKHKAPTRGPAWFRKMDKNRDGDVSRGEWLGTEELFREIDADGDGLISADEAERFDARRRHGK